MTDIELVPSEELFDELLKRYEVIIIMTGKKGREDVLFQYKGDSHACVGMCEHVKLLILRDSLSATLEDD